MKSTRIRSRVPRRVLTRLCVTAAALASYCVGAHAADQTYQMTFTLPCSGESSCSFLELLGTFVTDGTTGTLSASNLINWDLAIGDSAAGLNPIHLTENNSNFSLSGGATLTADSNGLTFGISKQGDQFSFSNGAVGWSVGGQAPIDLLNYFSDNSSYLAFKQVPANSQYTASSFGVTAPVPEPTTYAMMLAGLVVVGTIAARRRSFAQERERDTVVA